MRLNENIGDIFKDKNGKYAIIQFPNIPFMVWIICKALLIFITQGVSYEIINTVSFIAIFAWASLEIATGNSLFRKILGLIVIIVVTWNKFS